MIEFTEKESNVLKKRGLKQGNIVFKNVGSLANCFRRILLDEIPNIGLDTSTANMDTNDSMLTYYILHVISLIRVYEQGEFYLKVSIKGEGSKIITSDELKTLDGKPANVEKGVEICELSGNCYLYITGIKSSKGIGREHVKYSAVVGTVTYKPTDVIFVHYLNESGFIEDNMKAIPIGNYELDGKYIIWNDKYAKKCSKKDLKYAENLNKIKYTGKFLVAEQDYCKDFIITFKAENPKEVYKKVIEVINLELDKTITFDSFGTIEQCYSISVGEAIKYFCCEELETSIFSNYTDNNYKITIDSVDNKKIHDNAIKKIKKIIN